MSDFDAEAYWHNRLSKCPGLHGTGLIGLPPAWQLWLYRGKERAYLRMLARAGVEVRDRRVLDFGCGVGYFEDFWERLGAAEAGGIDIVPEVVAKLSRDHPHRKYVRANLSKDPAAVEAFPPQDMVTAIDVLYHIVDDDILNRSLKPLASLVKPGGHFLFTDQLGEGGAPSPHVRFRTLDFWRSALGEIGLEIIDKEPVFVINNRVTRLAYYWPGLTGAIYHYLDAPFLRLMPRAANNWVILARRAPAA